MMQKLRKLSPLTQLLIVLAFSVPCTIGLGYILALQEILLRTHLTSEQMLMLFVEATPGLLAPVAIGVLLGVSWAVPVLLVPSRRRKEGSG